MSFRNCEHWHWCLFAQMVGHLTHNIIYIVNTLIIWKQKQMINKEKGKPNHACNSSLYINNFTLMKKLPQKLSLLKKKKAILFLIDIYDTLIKSSKQNFIVKGQQFLPHLCLWKAKCKIPHWKTCVWKNKILSVLYSLSFMCNSYISWFLWKVSSLRGKKCFLCFLSKTIHVILYQLKSTQCWKLLFSSCYHIIVSI